jgi:uncharacterized membrane protein HdeD (DUF308 family)
MGNDEEVGDEGLNAAAVIRSRWGLFVLLGLVLMVAGAVAIALPALTTIAAERILATVLCLGGIAQIFQASKVANWLGFMWHLLLGLFATIGGVLIYIDSLYGVVSITILIAAIFAVLGVSQIAFAIKVRRMAASQWFLVSGAIALIVGALLLMRLPYSHAFTPATVAGVSLLFTGWAYVAISLASRETARSNYKTQDNRSSRVR